MCDIRLALNRYEIIIVCGRHIIMGYNKVPSIISLLDQPDANTVLSGVLDFKGCKVHKSATDDDCLSMLNRKEDEIDVVLIKKEVGTDRNIMLVENVRKISPGTIVIIMVDTTNEEESGLQSHVDEVVSTPISAENLADKILMLIAKKELKKIKEKVS